MNDPLKHLEAQLSDIDISGLGAPKPIGATEPEWHVTLEPFVDDETGQAWVQLVSSRTDERSLRTVTATFTLTEGPDLAEHLRRMYRALTGIELPPADHRGDRP